MQLLQEFRLGDRTAEVVNEDGGRAVRLQQRPEEPLQEGDELLVLLGLAHLGGESGRPSCGGQMHRLGAPAAQEGGPSLSHTEAAYCSVGSESPLETTAGFEMCSLL